MAKTFSDWRDKDIGLLISVVGVRLRTHPCSTHSNGYLLFRKTSKGTNSEVKR